MEILGLIESAIGLVLIYLVLSLICSAWIEAIVSRTGMRGENLHNLIKVQCGGDEKVANLLLAQPQLRTLYAPAHKLEPPKDTEGFVGRWWGMMVYWAKRTLVALLNLFMRLLALGSNRGQSERRSGFRPPSYIPPMRFARALSEMALGDSVERLRNTSELIEQRLSESSVLEHLTSCREQTRTEAESGKVPIHPAQCTPGDNALRKAAIHLSNVLTRLWHQSGGEADAFLKQIETWFEDGNDRATGWFKRKLAPKLFLVGLVIAIALNVDSLQILSRLSTDGEMRQSLVTMAMERVENVPEGAQESADELEIQFDRAKQSLLEMEPLMGWRASSLPTEADAGDWLLWFLMKLIGLLVTAIALSLGAPFWFDVLQKLVRVRASISQVDTEARAKGQRAADDTPSDAKASGEITPARHPTSGSATDETPRLLNGMVGLAPDAQSPDRVNARWMAELASLAYSKQPEVEQTLEGIGLQLDHFVDYRTGKPDINIGDVDTQGFIASNRDLTVVAFRGTEVSLPNPADVLTDLKARMLDIDWFQGKPNPRAHQGFLLALEAVWPELEEQLAPLASVNPARPIWFTGHSLGGALAVLAAARYSIWREDENSKREKRADRLLEELDENSRLATIDRIRCEAAPLPPCGWIYTIGQPAVGDHRLADWLDTRFEQRLVRTINNRDIVPRLPSPVLGYAHAGTVLYFDSFGRIKRNPGAWYRGLDTLVLDPERAREQAIEAFGDHKAETYIALLKS